MPSSLVQNHRWIDRWIEIRNSIFTRLFHWFKIICNNSRSV